MPDDKGTILIMNAQGMILDELHYEDKWHFKLLDNKEGIALERINYNKPTQDPMNWHSASTTSGYGTPGYQNSQFLSRDFSENSVTVSPQIFSPDNDGFEDFVTINYKFEQPGQVLNLTLFNANGRPVKMLARNALCGATGYFRWDGFDDRSNRLNTGIYILLVEIFNVTGKTMKFKKTVTLAGK
jgi:hypothetical protein